MSEDGTIVETPAADAGTGHWYEGFDSDTQAAVSKYESAEELAKGYASQGTLLGRSVTLPKDDATDEEKAEALGKVYGKLGRPDTAEGYTIEKPAELPEGVDWDDAVVGEFKTFCFENNVPQSMVDAFVAFDLKRTSTRVAARQEAVKTFGETQEREAAESIATLKAEVGEGNYEKYIANAERAFEKCGGEPLVTLFDKPVGEMPPTLALKNHPVIVRAFNEIYKKELAEDTIVSESGRPANATGTLSNAFYDKPDSKGQI